MSAFPKAHRRRRANFGGCCSATVLRNLDISYSSAASITEALAAKSVGERSVDMSAYVELISETEGFLLACTDPCLQA